MQIHLHAEECDLGSIKCVFIIPISMYLHLNNTKRIFFLLFIFFYKIEASHEAAQQEFQTSPGLGTTNNSGQLGVKGAIGL